MLGDPRTLDADRPVDAPGRFEALVAVVPQALTTEAVDEVDGAARLGVRAAVAAVVGPHHADAGDEVGGQTLAADDQAGDVAHAHALAVGAGAAGDAEALEVLGEGAAVGAPVAGEGQGRGQAVGAGSTVGNPALLGLVEARESIEADGGRGLGFVEDLVDAQTLRSALAVGDPQLATRQGAGRQFPALGVEGQEVTATNHDRTPRRLALARDRRGGQRRDGQEHRATKARLLGRGRGHVSGSGPHSC